ncbi:biofilm regulation diguanylate cyclase SiaD [Noviherbaspirillum sp. UKPF54]|uniref:biofilm regulation diguanylate cyclase SiaD n=1 Tax=Noviherbaspirillum sp. UKPF54 TaxID=2601898 RepID=UPI0011B11CBF|nr:biofilm regulation diguanylate cyclase SiaD [Noviherbaspirillum sp. UKPF54]QDZ29458.1 GGDEF domain-containing protein [Noviherbaspirillum sp. UKPF54]
MRDDRQLERTVESLLEDPLYADHPLRQALSRLYVEFRDAVYQMERITRISDRFQTASRENQLSLSERYSKQLRQLERLARISDRYQLMMRDLNEALKEASTKDALTGIGNRRMLMERLKAETARAERLGRPLVLAILDVDHFKSINDEHGHEAGDKALVELARVIESSVREYDSCGRWGGEEFLIIMPEIGADEAVNMIERVHAAVGALRVRAGQAQICVTASFGIAERRQGESISETINRADAALYAAKHAGRDRYEVAP